MVEELEADYLVVGAGAAGMAFTDALIDHSDAKVVLVDRRNGPGGHWLDAYPFVRLHQASAFYGVASTLLGGGRLQTDGPEVGLHERATAPEVCFYYARVLRERMVSPGRVDFHANCDYVGGHEFVSRVSGKRYAVRGNPRVVNAHYLAPEIPATTKPTFGIGEGAHVVPANDLVKVESAPSQYVVAGSGKTATDSVIWLLENGVDPDAICWVRPRDPWMSNRALVQPNKTVFMGMVAATFEAAGQATSPDDFFLRLEEAGVMLRIDRTVTPTMAKQPTLAEWELEKLRSIENVVRLGHIKHVAPGSLKLADGEVTVARDALVVHCSAAGLQYRPILPIWGPDEITVQPVRAVFPCFGAAVAGYVEATIDSDEEKNRLCPPSPYPNTPTDFGAMHVFGARAAASFNSNPDIKDWDNRVAINPAAINPDDPVSDELSAALKRVGDSAGPAMARMAEMAGIA